MLLSFALSDDKIDDDTHGRGETITDGRNGKAEEISRSQTFYERLHMGRAELQNRRLQVRFLSHLPLVLRSIGVAQQCSVHNVGPLPPI